MVSLRRAPPASTWHPRPTTPRWREVVEPASKGETALYAGVQDAVTALGTKGERSIVLLSDGGDTVAEIEGGRAPAAGRSATPP